MPPEIIQRTKRKGSPSHVFMVAELSGTTRGKSAAKDKPYRRRIGVPRERPVGPQRGAAESRSEDARQLQRFEELRQRGKPVWRWNHWRWVLVLLVGIFTYEGGFFVLVGLILEEGDGDDTGAHGGGAADAAADGAVSSRRLEPAEDQGARRKCCKH